MPTKRMQRTRTKQYAISAGPRPVAAPQNVSRTQDWFKPALLAGVLVFAWLGQDQLFSRQLWPGLACWLAAAVLLVALVRKPALAVKSEMEISQPLEAAILLGVLLLAGVVRIWNAANQPHGFSFDEAVNALIGLQMILDPGYVPIFGPPDAPLPTLFHYFNSLALRLGGVNVAAARLVPAFFGIATVGAVYFLARRMFSRPVALASVFFLAVMRWHINFSRIDFVGAATPFFGAAWRRRTAGTWPCRAWPYPWGFIRITLPIWSRLSWGRTWCSSWRGIKNFCASKATTCSCFWPWPAWSSPPSEGLP
jgi:hypothetical protein